MRFFEYLFKNNFGVHFFWTSGFVSWILGCCFWVLSAEFFSLIFSVISIVLCLVAVYDSSNLEVHGVSALRNTRFSVTPYFLIVSISVSAMVAFNSVAIGLTAAILFLLFLYDWRVLRKTKKKQDAAVLSNKSIYEA